MNQWSRFRLGLIFFLFLGFFGLVGFRLSQLQVVPNAELEALAKRQFTKTDKKTSFRLPLFDRNHEELAVSTPSSSLFARPKLIKARKRTANALAKLMGGTPQRWLQKLDPKKSFVWIQRQLSDDVAEKIRAMKLPGIFAEPENKRIYPNGSMASHVIGFTDVDGNGLAGIELTLNSKLVEPSSKSTNARDGKGNTSYIERQEADPRDAETGPRLTIDRRIQHSVEEELEKTMTQTQAKGAWAIVMDPYTGEILALSQRPTFDPNFVNQSPIDHTQNRFTQSLYEPGSTAKPLFAAIAIEKGLLTPQSPIDCGNGKLQIGNVTITEAEADHRYQMLSLEKVITHSSNVGAARVGERLKTQGLKETMDRFGLTRKTGINLPGETFSPLKADDLWKPVFNATTSFGQGFSVTPLQMVTAYAPFANGGFPITPSVLMEAKSKIPQARILSPKTVEQIRHMLIGVTEDAHGTGGNARIPGVRVAGKTGTAQKYEAGVGYNSGKYYSSFIGFLPADKPQVLIGVFVDEPKVNYTGGMVAAPAFSRIGLRTLQVLNKTSVMVKNEVERPVPTLPPVAKTAPLPKPVLAVPTVPLVLKPTPTEEMPDLKGITIREAMRQLENHLDQVRMFGNGYAFSQSPPPGAPLTAETPITIEFRPGE